MQKTAIVNGRYPKKGFEIIFCNGETKIASGINEAMDIKKNYEQEVEAPRGVWIINDNNEEVIVCLKN